MHSIIYYDILNYHPANFDLLGRHFYVLCLKDPSELRHEHLQHVAAIFAPLGYYCGSAIMEHAPTLKAVASNTTSDAHIDIELAEKRGIRVITLKTEQTFLDTITPTAELTIGLMIALTRNMVSAFDSVRYDAQWQRWPFGGEKMLSRMTLGIIGMGRLGRKVALAATALGMDIVWFDPHIGSSVMDFPGLRCDNLRDVAMKADVITAHMPHEPQLTGMLDAGFFAACKSGAYFINTARGELVDESALLLALEEGHLAGAALDVLANEFAPEFSETVYTHPLVNYARSHKNLLLTPHIGGSTQDAWQLTQEHTVLRLIQAFSSYNRDVAP